MSKFLSLACYLCPISVLVGVWIAIVVWEPADLVPACLWLLGVSLILSLLLKDVFPISAARPLLVGVNVGLVVAFFGIGPTIASRGVTRGLGRRAAEEARGDRQVIAVGVPALAGFVRAGLASSPTG